MRESRTYRFVRRAHSNMRPNRDLNLHTQIPFDPERETMGLGGTHLLLVTTCLLSTGSSEFRNASTFCG